MQKINKLQGLLKTMVQYGTFYISLWDIYSPSDPPVVTCNILPRSGR